MRILSPAIALISPLLMVSALTPVRAADMTFERALNANKEPQNWLLYYGNYQSFRFSPLNEIITDTVKNLKLVFAVALGGLQSGGRYAFGNLEGTPIVDDGMMYVTDGWGSVYAIDVSGGTKGAIKWKFDPGIDRAWAGDVACCGVNNRGVALWKDKVVSIALDGRMFAINKATSEHFTQTLLWPARKFVASSACAMLVMPAANSKTPSALTWSGRNMAAGLIAVGDDGSGYGEETARLYQCSASTLTTRSLPSNSVPTLPPDALSWNSMTRSFTATVALRMMSRP
jgi:glucose dehydrogenase